MIAKLSVERDQAVSPFSAILMRLCDATRVRCAALVDAEGETVDYSGAMSPYDIKVTAAEWRLAVQALESCERGPWATTELLQVRARHGSFLAVRLSDGYALVLRLHHLCFAVSRRALAEAVRDLSAEAGLEIPAGFRGPDSRWYSVEVQEAARHRPASLWTSGGWKPLQILGRFVASADRRDVGYRVASDGGHELTVVREPMGAWFTDEPV